MPYIIILGLLAILMIVALSTAIRDKIEEIEKLESRVKEKERFLRDRNRRVDKLLEEIKILREGKKTLEEKNIKLNNEANFLTKENARLYAAKQYLDKVIDDQKKILEQIHHLSE